MKKIILSIILASPLLLNSCDSLLDNEPNNYIVSSAITEENLPMLTAPLYNRVWFGFNNNFNFGLGDGMAYNLYAPYSDYVYPFGDLAVTRLTGPLGSAWSSLYQVVQHSTGVVKTVEESTAAQEAKNQYMAEARFMRGIAYWYLVSLWGNAIIVNDPQTLVDNPIVSPNPTKDVYEYAIRDLEFAAKYLPETASAVGRVTRYSAFGMLSRLYLDYAGLVASNYGANPNVGTRNDEYLELSKKAAEKVISNNAYKLMDNYEDLFKIENNNNAESLFAFQWVPGMNSETGYNIINSHQAYFAFGSAVTGDDAAWGSWTRCPYDMIKEYELNDTIRRKATWMGEGDKYAEINQSNGGLWLGTDADLGQIDRGNGNQFLNVKKGVTGSNKDNAAIGRMNSALDNYVLRLAEVYLNYAEAILGNNASTNDATALFYFNAVRNRAKLSSKTSITWEDLRHERRVEFCMEGRYWYDLLSRSYYKQQEIINYLNDQNRGVIPAFLFNAPNDLRLDDTREDGTRSVGMASAATFKLPYPESELIQNPKLGEAPIPFNFTEDRISDLFE